MNEDIGKQIADFADMMNNNYKEKQESFEHRVKMNMNQNNVNNKKPLKSLFSDEFKEWVKDLKFNSDYSSDFGCDETLVKEETLDDLINSIEAIISHEYYRMPTDFSSRIILSLDLNILKEGEFDRLIKYRNRNPETYFIHVKKY